ncbi:Glucan synthesis regulatory protein [Pseudocercospora fuligena]|uniref:Glucan synthesis regulatory protein n=1 Tax=Pseudocercospora fuligena TaxID=685502 RepID=A0A8H6RFB5_9PEZI|nr:Glucan synthesis regulatory protein [Pseudocercospora fuligena]
MDDTDQANGNRLASHFRAFWHTMTSNDRHAGPDASYRNDRIPVSQSRNGITSPSNTSALESRTDLDLEAGNGFVTSTTSPPYSPQRNSLSRQGSALDGKSMAEVGQGEIQMESFKDGLPPPPPVSHSWKRIDRWLEDNYEELFENLGMGATVNDVNELEHELDCTLPQEVRESLQIHDGQERGGQPTGVIFGCMLLDCEEIIQEWQQWRTVNEAYFNDRQTFEIPQAPLKAFAGSSSSAQVPMAQPQSPNNSQWRQELVDKQDSQPPNAVQKVYSHPAWIPLARDWGGNNIAVDLAPGPTGRWGQVILMGRDYDCKYVISRSWSAFLATVADDMHTDKWFIDEDTKELKLREFPKQGVEPAYIDIMRWRTDQKYGRRAPKKRPLRINSNVSPGANGFSPYGSPTKEDRGRSPHRYSNGKAPVGTSSPRGHMGSPLARVTEESPIQTQPQPLSLDTSVAPSEDKLISVVSTPNSAHPREDKENIPQTNGKLEDRRSSQPYPKSRLGSTVMSNSDDEETSPLSPAKEEGVPPMAIDDEMKEVKI